MQGAGSDEQMGRDIPMRIGGRVICNGPRSLCGESLDEEDGPVGVGIRGVEVLQVLEELLEGGDVVGLYAVAVDVAVCVLDARGVGGLGAEKGAGEEVFVGDHADVMLQGMSAEERLHQSGALAQWPCIGGVDYNVYLMNVQCTD